MGVIEASDRAWKVVQMKGEKQGVSAWLRGIIGECGVSGTRSCAAIAEAFGIDCKHERTCRDCITKMMTAITDRIDAERELPADVEWPRFEDGELVKMGDEVGFEGETMRVCEVALDADGWVLWCENDGLDGRLRGSYVERVKHPAPEVLDADGVPIKVGDTVWATYNGCKHIVMAVCSDGSLHPEMVTDDSERSLRGRARHRRRGPRAVPKPCQNRARRARGGGCRKGTSRPADVRVRHGRFGKNR